MERKIIQIAVDSQPYTPDFVGWNCVTALCSDGTVWELNEPQSRDAEWKKLPDIPQGEVG